MNKLLILLLALLLLLPLTACGEEEPNEVVFTEDLTLDVLKAILTEKGDAMLLTDIPEHYAYQFNSVGTLPQVVYPINEHITFCVMQSGTGNILMLSVQYENGTSADYVGAEKILANIDALIAEAVPAT